MTSRQTSTDGRCPHCGDTSGNRTTLGLTPPLVQCAKCWGKFNEPHTVLSPELRDALVDYISLESELTERRSQNLIRALGLKPAPARKFDWPQD